MAIEIEMRARFDEETYEKLLVRLAAEAEDLGCDDKNIYFYVLPDQLLKVTDNTAAGSAKITLKASKIGQGAAFPETEFAIARDDVPAAVRIFNALGFEGTMHQAFNQRHNFRFRGVEIAVKWSEAWGHHAEFEVLLEEGAGATAQEEATVRIRGVADELGIHLMTEQELADFTAAFETAEQERKEREAATAATERVSKWEQTGEKPSPVMVWTPEQTGAFCGLRRGEACGQPWSETNLDRHSLTVTGQLVQDGWEVEASEPKTDSGFRVVALDDDTVDVLKRHRERQEADRAEWGSAWVNTGLVFTQEDGSWLHPGKVTDLFERLVAASGLPPIRLHDLRHGAATLMLAADIDIKIVSDTLGHSDTRITRDIYQSVLPHVGKSAAEATAKLVPLQRKAEQEAQVRQAAEEAKKAAKAKAKRKKKAKAKKAAKKG